MDEAEVPNITRKFFSKSMKKIMGRADPLSPQCTHYLQSSPASLALPALAGNAAAPTRQRTAKSIQRLPTEKSALEKGAQLQAANQPKPILPRSLRRRTEQEEPSSMAGHVDDIMNQFIATHSPKLANNSAISRSISTKRFKNVRVLTSAHDSAPKYGLRTSLLIKEILTFMMRHSDSTRRKRAFKQDPEAFNEDLSRYSPIKLVKRSEELVGLYPAHEFKRQEQAFLNKPLNSETYIRQLRANKLEIRDLQLKRH